MSKTTQQTLDDFLREASEEEEEHRTSDVEYEDRTTLKADFDKVYENYILVIPETYEELESFGSSVQFDINSYNKACLEKLTSGLVEFTEVETTEEELDGNKAIIQKLVGSKQIKEDLSIDIFYELAVIEGEKGYYQVLSWTLADQRSKFESNMDRMTNSFKEI